MDLPPFLLDNWLAKHQFASPPISFGLGSSTGPRWSLDQLSALPNSPRLSDINIGYAPPDGGRALRGAIGRYHGVDPGWVVVTTGASEAISILFCLAAQPGGNIVVPSPAFPMFDAMVGAWGMAPRHYSISRQDGFQQSAENVLTQVNDRTVLTLVNTPHNPTSSIMDREEIAKLATALAERRIPLLVDEVYYPLSLGRPLLSAADIDNVIVVNDMSKALSLPGLRIGWVIDRNPERRKRIIDARSYFTISSSPFLEALATHALNHHDQIVARARSVIAKNMATLTAVMEKMADLVDWVPPAGGTTIFPWFRDGRNSRPFCETLAAAGVLVVPGDCFGMPAHLRLGFGAQEEGFEQAMAIFEKVVRTRA